MQEFPIKQIVQEFAAPTQRSVLDNEINDFIDEWSKDHAGNLRIASMHTIDKIYPGDQKKGTWVVVVFDWYPLTEEQRSLQLAMAIARDRGEG